MVAGLGRHFSDLTTGSDTVGRSEEVGGEPLEPLEGTGSGAFAGMRGRWGEGALPSSRGRKF